VEAPVAERAERLALDGEWGFRAESANALPLGRLWARRAAPGEPDAAFTAPDVDLAAWLPVVPGAWSYQLPAEPEGEYPMTVWYRVNFQADVVPAWLDVIVDGWACAEWRLFVNGQAVTSAPQRSAFDAEMLA